MAVRLFVCALFILHTLSSAENILIVPVHESRSHLGSMLPVINSMLSANYNITLLWTTTTNLKERPKVPEEVHVVHLVIPKKEGTGFDQKIFWRMQNGGPTLIVPFFLMDAPTKLVLEMYGQDIHALLNSQKWDLVVTDELFSPLGYAIAHKMKRDHSIPYLVLSTSTISYSFSVASALGRNPVSRMTMYWKNPEDPYVPYDPKQFVHRFWNFVDTIGETIMILVFGGRYAIPSYSLITGHHLQFEELFRQHSGLLLEDLQNAGFPYPVSNDIITTGNSCPEKRKTQLPPALEEFVSDPTSKGTIYVAFGSYISWDTAPDKLKEAFEGALNSFVDYRIVFSGVANSSMTSFGKHVKVMKWAPQEALLAHNNTKLFLTHGGMKSIKESICSRVPMLIMAVFAEQSQNARLIKETGAADTINKFTINSSLLKEKITELLNNGSCKAKMERLYKIVTDEVVSSRAKAIHATRCAISRSSKVYEKYKRRGLFQSWSQYLYLPEVLVFSGLIFCLSKQ